MDCSTPGLPVYHQLPEFTQTHLHWVSDAIQASHPLLSPSPPAPKPLPASGSFPMSQLFEWGGQSIGVSVSTLVLPMNTQNWSPLEWTGWISFQSKGLSRVFSNSTVLTSYQRISEVALSCPTLCDPMECSLRGSSIHGIFQTRVLEWVAISFSRALPDPGIKPRSLALQADTLPSEPPGKQKPFLNLDLLIK